MSVPAEIVADASGPAGAGVTFLVSATDPDDAAGLVSCSAASGSIFPIGSTAVTSSSTDTQGNTGSATFTITVRGAGVQLGALAVTVAGVGGGSFASQLQNVQRALAAGQKAAACGSRSVSA